MATDSPLYKIYASTIGRFHGVPVFFGLSGFLIWALVKNSASLSEYLKKRFIGIYPELRRALFLIIRSIALLNRQYASVQPGLRAIAQGTFFAALDAAQSSRIWLQYAQRLTVDN